MKLQLKKLISSLLGVVFLLISKLLMTEEQIKHLAKLAEIELSDEEVEHLKSEFATLLDFVGKLQSIDTQGVEMMYTPIESARCDYKRSTHTQVNIEDLLANSPHEVEDNMIVIKSSTVESGK